MKFYFVPEAHLSSLQVPTHSVLPTISQGGHCCHPHFTDKETNSERLNHLPKPQGHTASNESRS